MRIIDWSSDVCSSDLSSRYCFISDGTLNRSPTGNDGLPAPGLATVLRRYRHLDPGEALAVPFEAFDHGAAIGDEVVDLSDVDIARSILPQVPDTSPLQIGRAECRERQCADGMISVVTRP